MSKKLFLFIFSVVTLCQYSYCQLFTFSFTGSTCDDNALGNIQKTIPNTVVTPFSRSTGLTCVTYSGFYNSNGWYVTNSTTNGQYDATKYIQVTVTPSSGYSLAVSSVSFVVAKSGTGPTNGRISHNAFGDFNTSTNFTLANTSNTTIPSDFPSFIGAPGQAITFRIYGWGGTDASGNLRINNFSVTGAVVQASGGGTSNSLLTFDNANNRVGVNQTASLSYTLDVNGTLGVSNNLFAKNKVLIGNPDLTNMANYSLAVNGTAVVKKLVVLQNSTPWPDYVFSQNYKLRSLSSLKEYISEHRHLPDLPSTDEIGETGIDVSSNQKVLLKKIEELTLYIISLNQKQEKQDLLIKKLKTELNLLKNKKSGSID